MSRNEYQKKQLLDWLIILVSALILISGGVLFYQWKTEREQQEQHQKQQEIAKLEAKIKELQEQKKQYREVLLSDNPQIHSFLTDLLTTYVEKWSSGGAKGGWKE